MEVSFGLTLEDSTSVVQSAEVICGIENEFLSAETDGNVLVMNETTQPTYQEQPMECEMIEETFIKQWGADEIGASGSRTYNYVEEDIKRVVQKPDYESYEFEQQEEQQPNRNRYPVTFPGKYFVCQYCGVCFATQEALLSHRRVYSVCGNPLKCRKCGEIFRDQTQMRENAEENVEDYDHDEDEDNSEEDTKYGTIYCTICGLSFHRQDNLRRHQKLHKKDEYVPDNEFPFSCMLCRETFPDENTLAVHVLTEHGKSLPRNTCKLCGRTCTNQEALLKHSRQHFIQKNFACGQCAKTFQNKTRLKSHMLSHRNKVVTCDVCGKEFPDGKSLLNHKHLHSNVSGRQFPCGECGKRFGSQSAQQSHNRTHTGERPYGCRFCWKAFADRGTLRKHERIHTGEKPYVCAVCPRAFNQRVVLRNHIMSHHSGPHPKYINSMTPYCCSNCSDMFFTSQDLLLHLLDHCDENRDMKRQPQVGPRKYKRRQKLKPHELELISGRIEDEEHERSEKPFRDLSNFSDEETDRRKRYTRTQQNGNPSPTSLKEPIAEDYTDLINSCYSAIGERPYECRFCRKAFADGGTLRKHERIHTGEKPFACAVCPRAFNQRVELRTHINSQHSTPDPKYINSMTPYCCSNCSDMFVTSQDLLLHLLDHCDEHRDMKRQPQVGPRKYKRRQKLKPHELELISGRIEDEEHERSEKPFRDLSNFSDEETDRRKRYTRTQQNENPSPTSLKEPIAEDYTDLINSRYSAIDGGTLRKHERIHTGEKPFACAVCPRAFNQRVLLRNHIMSHHSGPHPKYINSMTPYCCSNCSDMFVTSQDLLLHLLDHCDENRDMKRQSQVGPRKYKRRRKLKPHELELISGRIEDEEHERSEKPFRDLSNFSDEETDRRKRYTRTQQNENPSPTSLKEPIAEDYTDLINSRYSAIDRINSLVNSKSSDQTVSCRPNMIDTQKTRVPDESGEDGRDFKSTRTEPAEIKSATGELDFPDLGFELPDINFDFSELSFEFSDYYL